MARYGWREEEWKRGEGKKRSEGEIGRKGERREGKAGKDKLQFTPT